MRLPGGRFGGSYTTSRTVPGPWRVPPYLRGLACQQCGYFFQDGETHGEIDFTTGEALCRTRVIQVTNRPSRALVRASRPMLANVYLRVGIPGMDITL